MAQDLTRGERSKASIMGHPLHPMIVPFPIAFLIGAFVSDIVFASSGDAFWARGSMWLIAAALVMGAIAAVLGLIDFASIPRARNRVGWTHVIGNVTAVVVSLINLIIRIADPAASVLPTGIILSAIVVVILGVTGWMGGELVFRHKIGVIDETPPVSDRPANYPRAAE